MMSRLRNKPVSSRDRTSPHDTSIHFQSSPSSGSQTLAKGAGGASGASGARLGHQNARGDAINGTADTQNGTSAEDNDDEEDDGADETAGEPDAIAPSNVQAAVKTNADGDASMLDAEQWVGLEKPLPNGTIAQENVTVPQPQGRSRSSSSSTASSGAAASDFDVPDDDDDYAELDNVSNASDDLQVEREESLFIRDALETENAWDNELSHEETIDWADENTYQETPSGLYDDILESYGMQDSPLNHISTTPGNMGGNRLLPAFGERGIDPHLSHALFRPSSLSTDSSSASSSEGLTLTPDETMSTIPDFPPGDSNDSDTEVEDMTEELAQRAEMLEQRRKAERRRKKNKKRKPRSKSLDSEQGALVLKKFPAHPQRPLAYTVMTPKGSVLRFSMPKKGHTRFRWVTGRTRPNPLELSPMTPAYASAMQGRLFQLYHCPTTPNLAPRRSKAMGGEFGRSSSFSNPGPFSVQRSFTASGGLSEAFFVNLDEASDDGDSYGIMDLIDLDGDDSTSAADTGSSSTPLKSRSHSLPGRVSELDDDEAEFHATSLSSRCQSPIAQELPSRAMESPTATKRRFSDTSDALEEYEGPCTKRQSLNGVPSLVV